MTNEAPAPLAVDGGAPVRTLPFPVEEPSAPAEDDDALAALEAEFASFLGLLPGSAIAVDSPEAARALALRAFGLDAGSEVVVPAVLADDLATACLEAGLRVVPAEVDADTATLSPRGLASALGERSALVVVTHAFGHPAPMPELLRLVRDRAVPLLEDASTALGASSRGESVGSFGDVSLFALPGHLLDASGAVLVARDAARAAWLRAARDAPPSAGEAARALAALRAAPEALGVRRQLAWHLTEQLRGMRAVARMTHGRWVRHSYDCYVVRLRSLLWKRPLEESVAAIRAEGIPCEPAVGRSLHLDTRVRERLGAGDPRLEDERFPVATRLHRESIAFPLPTTATTRDMDDVAAALRKVEQVSI